MTATDFRNHSRQSRVKVKLPELIGMTKPDSPEKVSSKTPEIFETGADEVVLE